MLCVLKVRVLQRLCCPFHAPGTRKLSSGVRCVCWRGGWLTKGISAFLQCIGNIAVRRSGDIIGMGQVETKLGDNLEPRPAKVGNSGRELGPSARPQGIKKSFIWFWWEIGAFCVPPWGILVLASGPHQELAHGLIAIVRIRGHVAHK